jgi:hypothetical protein
MRQWATFIRILTNQMTPLSTNLADICNSTEKNQLDHSLMRLAREYRCPLVMLDILLGNFADGCSNSLQRGKFSEVHLNMFCTQTFTSRWP